MFLEKTLKGLSYDPSLALIQPETHILHLTADYVGKVADLNICTRENCACCHHLGIFIFIQLKDKGQGHRYWSVRGTRNREESWRCNRGSKASLNCTIWLTVSGEYIVQHLVQLNYFIGFGDGIRKTELPVAGHNRIV